MKTVRVLQWSREGRWALTYLLRLIVVALLMLVLTAPAAAQGNSPHFWSVFSGDWEILDGRLSTIAPTGGESWIWAGANPILTSGDFEVSLTVEFANNPGGEIGRHGGIMFYAAIPTHRGDFANTGYTIDWIDRFEDRGLRLYRWDNGNPVGLVVGTPQVANPPLVWRIQVQGDMIRFFGDGQLVFEVVDSTYRSGHFGLGDFQNGTHMLFDDVQIGRSFHDNFQRPFVSPPPEPGGGGGNVSRGWTIYSGLWQILGERLFTESPIGGESWIWAGAPPLTLSGDFEASVTIDFANMPQDGVGRHGGIMFFASVPTYRGDFPMNGYTIDWIDRFEDHGFRFIRFDNGNATVIAPNTPNIAEPPRFWQVQVQGEMIRFYADGQLISEFTDNTYRSGHFGLWACCTGTQIYFDDVRVGRNFRDDFSRPSL